MPRGQRFVLAPRSPKRDPEILELVAKLRRLSTLVHSKGLAGGVKEEKPAA